LNEGVQWLRDRGVAATGSVEYGHAVDCIAATAGRIAADLIVVGHRNRSRLARWWSQSDEESLLERVRCSILVAQAPEE
jgi:nucleotide-binding universal stress UspA family protein